MIRRHSTAQPSAEITWHALPVYDVLEQTRSSANGLQEGEAQRRLALHGLNQLAPAKRRGPLRRLLVQFHNVLLYVMLAASAITAMLGHWVDTGVLLAAVVLNAIIGFIQE
ncbi:MAG: cation-transporting P-type ATPase, partial [Pollutimonas bauzanensis]